MGGVEKEEMIEIQLLKHNHPLEVLCIGAHSDDIEIGCGGTILKLLEDPCQVSFHWVVLSSDKQRRDEAIASAQTLIAKAARKTIVVKDFRDGFFPYVGGDIKDYFEQLKREVCPDLVFTHYRADLHQDHRLVSELTWNTFRNHLILEYEVVKYDGDLGRPNAFVPLDEAFCEAKIRHVLDHFPSQTENQWFSADTLRAILRIRGIESNSASHMAEGFYVRKLILAMPKS